MDFLLAPDNGFFVTSLVVLSLISLVDVTCKILKVVSPFNILDKIMPFNGIASDTLYVRLPPFILLQVFIGAFTVAGFAVQALLLYSSDSALNTLLISVIVAFVFSVIAVIAFTSILYLAIWVTARKFKDGRCRLVKR